VAIVVDRLSASTSELFAAGLRDLGRARVFGDTTAGEALPATMARLPNGDLLIHAIADFHAAGGGRIESTGVVPDVYIPLTRRDLLAGRDLALGAALKWAGALPVQAGAAVTSRSRQP
jgi:carboxyl-terminal processing protease